ncbi:hypothetical protein QAD02_011145 [Eretmocerus hayati]|uniref:Uncharacterized protein n=1 Tax=Eretmocerus hayati TaxID=131215 RepID=A0ACC2NW97_9HYME|nr:hypothetical protein QAD02_011145 [Eretmocerus hayati]
MFSLKIVSILFLPAVISISLDGKWKGQIVSSNIPFEAEVPGGVFSDLERVGLIPNNLEGFNDVQNRWVANESIDLSTNFEVDAAYFSASHIALIFYGIDTFSTILINGVEIGKTDNMFLRYSFDIKDKLKIGSNELQVNLRSSVKESEKLYNVQSSKYVVPPKCVPKDYNGECHVNYIRKMQASYGWDWGAAFPSMGIWKSVEIQQVDKVLLSQVSADVLKGSDSWEIVVSVFFESFEKSGTDFTQKVHINCKLQQFHIEKSFELSFKNNLAKESVILKVPLDQVEFWWPNGYGKQKLYVLDVTVDDGFHKTQKTIKIGFRTVDLVQDRLQKGTSFYFKVNGVPIFAKGTNWIPSSIFPEKSSQEKILKHLLQSSRDTHMNMMRVWGGGVYESDLFYNLADEYGIMIWQDFMFACSMYPTTDSYLESVRKEVTQNVLRLKNHPSVVLWAGNNENEAALYGNWYGTEGAQIYKDDYVKLYVDVIKDQVIKVDPHRPYVVSSPSNGVYSEEQNYTESNPYSNLYGDVHYYNYLRNSWDINQYPITRFASEYGFQSLPSIWTLSMVTKNLSDLQWNSTFMKHRQHLPGGNSFLKLLISKNFIIPENDNPLVGLMNYVYLSQVSQAVSMKIETESYRQMKNSFNDIDEGMTMGALYWQLNDVWVAPSWSSIDHTGRWKMLHYYVKDFFSPIIITSRLSRANELSIHVVSDVLQSLSGLVIKIKMYDLEESRLVKTVEIKNVSVESNQALTVKKYWYDMFLNEAGCGPASRALQKCMVELILESSNGSRIAPLNYVYPQTFKEISLPHDNIRFQIRQSNSSSSSSYEIELTSSKIALFVWVEMRNITGTFSENGFHILENKKRVTFQASQASSLDEIKKNFDITSLSRLYNSELRASDAKLLSSRFKND